MADDQLKELFGSDSEDEQLPLHNNDKNTEAAGNSLNAERDQMRDLFGSDDEDDDQLVQVEAQGDDVNVNDQRQPTPEEEDEPVLRGPPIHVPVPLHDVLASEPLRLTKLSNIISIEDKPFSRETYEPAGTEYFDERGNKRIRLHDTNAIRWRWAVDANGTQTRESNAKLVRWSDGSVTLSVGDEVMDVREVDISGDHTFLFTRHSNLIQGQGPLLKKLTLRPSSLTSTSHKRLTAAVGKHHGARQQKVRATTTLVDPKKEKEEREKIEEARIRDLEKLTAKQDKQMRRYNNNTLSSGASRHRVLSAAYLDEDDQDEEDEDDGWLVKDDEEERENNEDDEEYKENGDNDDLRRALARNEDEEAEAERRLAAAKTSAPPPVIATQSAGGILQDSDDGDDEGEDEDVGAKKKHRSATLLMESDDE